MPFPNWSTKHRNLRADNIVLVRHDHKYSTPDYRMWKMMEVQEQVLHMRPRDAREKSLLYQSKNLFCLKLLV